MAHSRVLHLLPLALLGCALAAPAGAAAPGTETFDGVCEMSGTVRHQPPLTQTAVPTDIRGSFSGTCSGTFTDRYGQTTQLDGAPADYRVRDAGGALSCNGGTATGTGSLIFGRGQAIEFTLTERRPAPGVAIVTLEGADGGTATVLGTLSPEEDPVELSDRCAGAGVRVIHGDARIVSAGLAG
ncbi:MAG TPA: hypothetical protein VF587_06360 [Solirubrobacteraceae bacterium]|jgi:hypothetical protein